MFSKSVSNASPRNVRFSRRVIGSDQHNLWTIDFMDDSGLGLLVAAVKRVREEGGSLVLRNPRDQILRVLEVTGLAKIPGLTIEHDGENP